jgi:hypothetical protein
MSVIVPFNYRLTEYGTQWKYVNVVIWYNEYVHQNTKITYKKHNNKYTK